MSRPSVRAIAEAVAKAEAGVDYSAKNGAVCPWCKARTRIVKTMPWDGDLRVRYHKCDQRGCVLSSINQTVKSVQVDN